MIARYWMAEHNAEFGGWRIRLGPLYLVIAWRQPSINNPHLP